MGEAPLNVLFITADQWRADCLSCAGHPMVRTPNMDALAGEGVRFANHYTVTAPCGPSRASLHTGLYLHNHRSVVNGAPLDARHPNWALEAGKLGYDAVLFGYTDTSADPRGLEADDPRLFSYEGLLPGLRPVMPLDGRPQAWVDWLAAQGIAVPAKVERAYGWRLPGPDWEDGAPCARPLAFPAEVDDTAFLVGRAIDYMACAKDPFIAHLSLLRPHPPWVAPEPYNRLYDPPDVPGFIRRDTREEEAAQHPYLAWRLTRPGFAAHANERRLRRLKAVYLGLITRVDAELGRLFAFLRQAGLIDRTLIIFTSDHGEELGDHWTLDKGGYFQGSYRIPLIIRDPRRAADAGRGRVVEAFTESVDVAPTMLSAIGVGVPRAFDGADLGLFLAGAPKPADWRSEAHFEFDFRDVEDMAAERELGLTLETCNLAAVVGERWKYVHFAGLPPLLFDLANDPGELNNLAADAACAPVALDEARKLLSWRLASEERTLTHMALTSKGLVARA
ncbi:MAG TPA: alkaline phosphatase family protein [Caulobacteraceae bacterium]|nr:alkaline phosphatase family protein [Caulobacteraceae bacterium]